MNAKRKIIKDGTIVMPDGLVKGNLLIENGIIVGIMKTEESIDEYEVIDASGKMVMPGMIDTHNHMGDPGPFSFREDWYCGSCSAASGGITTICDMPLPSEPATVDRNGFEEKKKIAEKQSIVDFALWGGLIPNCIQNMKELKELGCIGFKGFMSFATEAYPRISDGYLVKGMKEAATFDGLIALHAENAEAAEFGCHHYKEMHCEDEACFDDARPWWTEYEAIQRALLFAEVTGSRVEICHTTISQGAKLIREAKQKGVKVFAETCPHYLIFDRTILREKKSFAKCTPPFRGHENVEKMWEYIKNGTIDVIGSDHGPFTDAEKIQKGNFWEEYCGFGCNDVVFSAMITEGIHRRGLSWTRLAELTSGNAAKMLGLYPNKGNLYPGADADIVLIDPNKKWFYDGQKSFSKTKSIKGPYQGMELTGQITDTFVRGECIYKEGKILGKAGYGKYVRSGNIND